MIIEEAPDLKESMLQALRAEYMTDRQRPGLHLSTLVYCLTKGYWDATDPEPPTEQEVKLWSIGYALERVMIARLHVEPMVVDGITMTPDFALSGVPSDLKSTRMAPTQSDGCAVCGLAWKAHAGAGHQYEKTSRPFNFPIGWQRQFMGYRYGFNQQEQPAYDFAAIVFHLIQPELTAWRVHFTHNELVENWNWVLERADQYSSMLAAQEPMPFQWLAYEGECAHCRYALRCQLTASLAKEGNKDD